MSTYFQSGTVFQLGKTTIAKDLIFGWCIGRDGIDGGMWIINEIPTNIMTDLAKVDYPAYMQDFKTDITAELKRREMQAEVDAEEAEVDVEEADELEIRQTEHAKKVQAEADASQPFSDFPPQPRHEDRCKLVIEILTKTIPCTEFGGITVASLGYVRIDNLGTGSHPWRAVNMNGSTAWEETFPSVETLIDRILARYW